MELPNKKIPKETESPTTMIIYGPPKVGKTGALSNLDGCLILDLEDGTSHIEALKIKISSLKDLHEVSQLIKEKNYPYKYIAVDTISKLEDWCDDLATRQYKATNIGRNFKGKSVTELPMGAGYGLIRNVFKEWLGVLLSLAPHVILVGHIKDKYIENKKGEEVQSVDLDLTGKLKTIACAAVDAIGYVYREDGKTMITFATNEEITCGTRCDHLKGVSFPLEWNKIFID